jgi:hypothetical protein
MAYARLDWMLLRDGCVSKFWQPVVFDAALAQLASLGYEIVRLDASLWSDLDAMYDDVAEGFDFPDHFGRNANALLDCFSDVAGYEYGAHADATGMVLAVDRYDSFAATDPEAAHALVDAFARQARVGLLVGHRMMCLLQTDDPDLEVPDVGASAVRWNMTEFLSATRHPEDQT